MKETAKINEKLVGRAAVSVYATRWLAHSPCRFLISFRMINLVLLSGPDGYRLHH